MSLKDVISRYGDMLDMPHHVSKNHPQMSAGDRAAQFSPFAALTGHEEALEETARATDRKIELDENAKAMLNEKLQMINELEALHPEVTLVYFRPDELKSGGAYITVTDCVKRIDTDSRTVCLCGGKTIHIDDILNITGNLFHEYE